jgi:hypothetical protein
MPNVGRLGSAPVSAGPGMSKRTSGSAAAMATTSTSAGSADGVTSRSSPSAPCGEAGGLNLRADTRRIRGLLRGTWNRPATGGSGGKIPGYGTEPWDGEWLPRPKLSGAPLIRDHSKLYDPPFLTPEDGALVPAPPGFDHADRLGDLDSSPGPESRDADRFQTLPLTYRRLGERKCDQTARWNERPLRVKPTSPTTIEERTPDWRLVYAYAVVRGELTIDGASRKIASIEADIEADTEKANRIPSPTERGGDDSVRQLKVAKLKRRVDEARTATGLARAA